MSFLKPAIANNETVEDQLERIRQNQETLTNAPFRFRYDLLHADIANKEKPEAALGRSVACKIGAKIKTALESNGPCIITMEDLVDTQIEVPDALPDARTHQNLLSQPQLKVELTQNGNCMKITSFEKTSIGISYFYEGDESGKKLDSDNALFVDAGAPNLMLGIELPGTRKKRDYPEKIVINVQRLEKKNRTEHPDWEQEILPNPTQQNKLVSALFSGDIAGAFSERITASEKEKERVLRKLAAGQFSFDEIEGVLTRIKRPIDYEENSDGAFAFSQLESYPHFKEIQTIVAVALNESVKQGQSPARSAIEKARETVNNNSIMRLLETYKTPLTLGRVLDIVVAEFAKDPTEYEVFNKSMKYLFSAIYGKRYEYTRQLLYLYEQAQQLNPEKRPVMELKEIRICDRTPWEKATVEDQDGVNRKRMLEAFQQDQISTAKDRAEIRKAGQIPIIIAGTKELHVCSIPTLPDIRDDEALEILDEISTLLRKHDPEAQKKTLFLRISNLVSPMASDNTGEGSVPKTEFDTKSQILRVLLANAARYGRGN